MEHHEAVYEQIIEVNNGNQPSEYYSQHIEQEIVVQNDEHQKSRINYEISNMDIILPNECINVQEQCNSNVPVLDRIGNAKQEGDFILQQDVVEKQECVPHVNNVVDNVISFSESQKEVKTEEYVFHSQTIFQEQNYEVSNSVVNQQEVDKVISEAIVDTSESVPISNVNVSVPDLSENIILDNHDNVSSSQSVSNNVDEEKSAAVKSPDSVLQIEYAVDSAQIEQKVETVMEVETAAVIAEEVVAEHVVEVSKEPQTELESNKNTEEASDGHSNEIDAHLKEEVAGVPNPVEEEQVLINSDDVAVLTEYSSMEYNMQGDISEEVVHEKLDVVEISQPQQVEDTLENQIKVHIDELTKEEKEDEVLAIEKDEKEEVVSAVVLEDASTEVVELVESIDKNLETSSDEPSQVLEELENDTEEFENDTEEDIDLHLSTHSTENQRKVIQDIFDDWTDENGEEEISHQNETYKDHHDSVELELQSLLNEEEEQVQTVSSTNTSEHVLNDSHENEEKFTIKSSERTKSDKAANKSVDSKPRYSREQSHGRSTRSSSNQDVKQKVQTPRPGVKVPGLHLTSPIASTAEVNEVLNKRLKEKQKDLQTPKQPDIMLIKKITQRLSSQLSQVVTTSNLMSIPPKDTIVMDKSIEEVSLTEQQTSKNTLENDSNELLAILEGDVDPDWSNLKPVESNKIPTSSPAGKLDPVMERELALKQLLELPNVSSKKSPTEKVPKKITKKTAEKQQVNKASGKTRTRSKSTGESEVVEPTTTVEEPQPKKKSPKEQKENTIQNARSDAENSSTELGVEESRSGRKRKLTEKAREHELAVKRQKVVKGKTNTETKKSDDSSKKKEEDASGKKKEESASSKMKEEDASSSAPAETEKVDDTSSEPSSATTPKSSPSKAETPKQIKTEPKESKNPETKTRVAKGKLKAAKQQKIALLKKDARISKRKLAVKNLMRQKVSNKKAAIAAAKLKEQASAKTPTTTKSTSAEKPVSLPTAQKHKKISEIDRLLQDEGVVNLLYNVEQPDSKKRLVPLTKTHKKVVDVEKAERELNLRAKMVRNAVMSTTSSSTVSPSQRSRRSANIEQPSPQSEKKASVDTPKTSKPAAATSTPIIPSNFVMPAKIRNAADASRIIRRHSSSSFSSTSASPRVSVDMPPETLNLDEPETQAKPTKRKLSNDSTDKGDSKKTKKKVASKAEPEAKEEKSLVKKVTRSNVAAPAATAVAAKISPKTKKTPKGRTSADSTWNEVKNSSKDQNELEVCLAEAVSALSSINGSSRSSSAASGNRKKGSTSAPKSDESSETKKFSNKEISVRQHGHLVQLIMTPSAPVSGIRNAITIPVMNEICEALSILQNDNECRVVLFTSTGTSFCEGLELSDLLHSNKDERKASAEKMAAAVNEFIRALSTFNKPIVAGVQGAAIGLGVTMLPLFDLVIASDKATFCTPYGKLGQIAEGAAILTLSHSLGSAVTNELLLGGRILTASEALRAGLVTRVLWPDRFQGELLPSLKGMSEQSAQSMEATKALLRHSFRQKLEASLESETALLVKHWCSPECQEAVKAYIDEKGQ